LFLLHNGSPPFVPYLYLKKGRRDCQDAGKTYKGEKHFKNYGEAVNFLAAERGEKFTGFFAYRGWKKVHFEKNIHNLYKPVSVFD